MAEISFVRTTSGEPYRIADADSVGFLNLMHIEQGSVNSTSGSLQSARNIVRTGRIDGAMTIYVPDGFRIRAVVYFNSETGEFDSGEIVGSAVREYTVGKDGCYARVSFGRIDEGDLTPSDLRSFAPLEDVRSEAISEAHSGGIYWNRIVQSGGKWVGSNKRMVSSPIRLAAGTTVYVCSDEYEMSVIKYDEWAGDNAYSGQLFVRSTPSTTPYTVPDTYDGKLFAFSFKAVSDEQLFTYDSDNGYVFTPAGAKLRDMQTPILEALPSYESPASRVSRLESEVRGLRRMIAGLSAFSVKAKTDEDICRYVGNRALNLDAMNNERYNGWTYIASSNTVTGLPYGAGTHGWLNTVKPASASGSAICLQVWIPLGVGGVWLRSRGGETSPWSKWKEL